jgi:V/A-type H+-transporting ATPase subunit E
VAEETHEAAAVQGLIDRLRDSGRQAGKQEADRIVKQARSEAARILAEAKDEIAKQRQAASAEIEKEREAALASMRLAARDASLALKGEVMASFERHMKRLVGGVTRDPDLIKKLVLALAGQAGQGIKDRDAAILVPQDIFEGGSSEQKTARSRVRKMVLGLTSDMLREGITLSPADDVHGGARVQLKGEHLEIDFTDEAVSQLLLRHLMPRFRQILEGDEAESGDAQA